MMGKRISNVARGFNVQEALNRPRFKVFDRIDWQTTAEETEAWPEHLAATDRDSRMVQETSS